MRTLALLFLLCAATASFAQNWQWLSPTVQGNNLKSIFTLDDRHGWAVGECGTILTTVNGGESWACQQREPTDTYYSVCFADSATGWVSGARWDANESRMYGIILHTHDGGLTWTTQRVEGDESYLFVTCLTPEVAFVTSLGYLASNGNFILNTQDGGQTWTVRAMLESAPTGLQVLDNGAGWAWSENLLWHTTNSGVTWSLLPSNLGDASLAGARFFDALYGLAGTWDGRIFRTVNGGSVWYAVAQLPTSQVCSATFDDLFCGWALDPHGHVYRSTDSGNTWLESAYPVMASSAQIASSDPSHAWIVGEAGLILRTTDGGLTWPQGGTALARVWSLQPFLPR
jgi:photosystem II stability/assembly factor-like uncharacterized protein